MSDLVDRRQAIDAICDFFGDNDGTWSAEKITILMDVGIIIANLPSVQPEERTNKRTETHACDCISRQEAIDAVKGEIEINGYPHVVDVIEQLPSAQPESKTGKWIPASDKSGLLFTCSCCKAIVPIPTIMGEPFWEHCPRCGCKMEVEHE